MSDTFRDEVLLRIDGRTSEHGDRLSAIEARLNAIEGIESRRAAFWGGICAAVVSGLFVFVDKMFLK